MTTRHAPSIPDALVPEGVRTIPTSVFGPIPAEHENVTARRLIALAVALAAAVVLATAAWLEPSPTGLGTHTQMVAMPRCGWIATMDVPCPTCGMTTAFAHVAEGDLLAAVLTQPLGALLAVVTAMALVIGLFVAVTGTRVATLIGRLWSARTSWAIGGFAAAAWGYKILSYKGIL